MEETIRKIMDAELMGDAGDSERCAEKISEMFEKFFIWFNFENITYFPAENRYGLYAMSNEECEWLNFEELFSYWLININNK